MFTVDKEHESTIITTLDSSGEYEDIEVIMDAAEVIIRQWDEEWQQYQVMFLSHQQLNDIRTAIRGL